MDRKKCVQVRKRKNTYSNNLTSFVNILRSALCVYFNKFWSLVS